MQCIRDSGLIPVLGRSLGGGHSNLLQYFCLKNPMDRGAWQTTVHRVTKSRKWPKQLSANALMHVPRCQWGTGPHLVYQNPQMFNFLILNGVVFAYNIKTSSLYFKIISRLLFFNINLFILIGG